MFLSNISLFWTFCSAFHFRKALRRHFIYLLNMDFCIICSRLPSSLTIIRAPTDSRRACWSFILSLLRLRGTVTWRATFFQKRQRKTLKNLSENIISFSQSPYGKNVFIPNSDEVIEKPKFDPEAMRLFEDDKGANCTTFIKLLHEADSKKQTNMAFDFTKVLSFLIS